MDKFFKFGYYALMAVVGIIILLALVSVFPITGNYKIKVVLSGSMEPAIKTGSIVIIKPADNYKVDDVITFGKDTKKDVPTTHRIIETRAVSGEMIFTTKGDANNGSDAQEVKENAVIGKVLFSVPYAGFLIDFAKKPVGFILLVIVPCGIIAIDELRKIWLEIAKIRKKKKERSEISFEEKDENEKTE